MSGPDHFVMFWNIIYGIDAFAVLCGVWLVVKKWEKKTMSVVQGKAPTSAPPRSCACEACSGTTIERQILRCHSINLPDTGLCGKNLPECIRRDRYIIENHRDWLRTLTDDQVRQQWERVKPRAVVPPASALEACIADVYTDPFCIDLVAVAREMAERDWNGAQEAIQRRLEAREDYGGGHVTESRRSQQRHEAQERLFRYKEGQEALCRLNEGIEAAPVYGAGSEHSFFHDLVVSHMATLNELRLGNPGD